MRRVLSALLSLLAFLQVASAQTNPTGPVDLIMFMGQSNMAGRGITNTTHPEDAPALTAGAGYEFRAVTDPTRLYTITKTMGVAENVSGAIDDGTKKTGGMAPAFANAYYAEAGVPVVAVSASKGGTSINRWQPGTAMLNDAISRLQKARNYLSANGISVRRTLMLWCQGETDGDNHMSGDEWQTKFRLMLDAMEKEGVEQCMLVRIGQYNGANTSVNYADIIAAQDAAAQRWRDVRLVSTSMAGFKAKGYMKDEFHYYQDAYNIVGTEAGRNSAEQPTADANPVRTDGQLSVLRAVTDGAFPLLNGTASASIVFDQANEHSVVGIAAGCLSNDVKLLSQDGTTPRIFTSYSAFTTFLSSLSSASSGQDSGSNSSPFTGGAGEGSAIVVGTVGTSSILADIMAQNADIKAAAEAIEGKWETFCLHHINYNGRPTLVIMGSDPRGTAYGVFELSRAAGLSPWYWWADVNPETTSQLFVQTDGGVYGPPSVKFRGLFINDEDWGMKPWASSQMDPSVGDIGPNTYSKVFELLLRLKANYIWPAMHECTAAFWKVSGNAEVARQYDIVLGSSHCEPMLRNNVYEWSRDGSGSWNWQTNSTNVRNYWQTRVQESVNNDAVYTVGMRGIHDGSMPGYSNKNEKAEGLKDVIRNQRQLLTDILGRDASTVPQIFCPYKEVLTLYRIGLDLPDDITLCWADDNHGYIRQLSDDNEMQRSGGGGVYYHFSYWGSPIDYLWLSSMSPALTSFEMSKAYARNCGRLWVFNVGDIKPAESELSFSMDLAWNVDAWKPAQADNYIRQWAEETFGAELADDIEAIKRLYYRLGAEGKPEHVHAISYTEAEMDARLADYAKLVDMVGALEGRIPARLSDAYYELIAYPCRGAAAMNRKHLYAKKSFLEAARGDRARTIEYANLATAAFDEIKTLTTTYNTGIAGGKWNGMMSYKPRRLSQFNEPSVATIADVVKADGAQTSSAQRSVLKIAAGDYSSLRAGTETFETVPLLGVGGSSLTIWPLQQNSYTAANATAAPYAEYQVPVRQGTNQIAVRCLPSFPIHQGLSLRYAISVDGAAPVVHDLTLSAETSPWKTFVLQGYTAAADAYSAPSDKTIPVRIYFLDPGLVVSELDITQPGPDDLTFKP